MSKTFFTSCLLLISFASQAQSDSLIQQFGQPDWKKMRKPAFKMPEQKKLPFHNMADLNQALALRQLQADTALFSHSTAQGDVYKLPLDNMPCLVPLVAENRTNAMPGTVVPQKITPYQSPANQMPNTQPVKPLIFKKPEAATSSTEK